MAAKNRARKQSAPKPSKSSTSGLSKGDLKRREILEAAISIMAASGVENLTYEIIGKKTGIGRSLVVYYFPTREEIIEGAVRLITETAQKITIEAMVEAYTPRLAFAAVIEGAFTWAQEFPDHARVMSLFYYYCTYIPRYRALHTEIREAGNTRLQGILAELLPRTPQQNFRELASQVQSLIHGQIVEKISTDKSKELSVYKKSTLRHAFRLVGVSDSEGH